MLTGDSIFGCAEAQEYRENVRGQKEKVYEQYLWRKAMLIAYGKHVDFMMSPEWEATYSAAVDRHALVIPILQKMGTLKALGCRSSLLYISTCI